MVVELEANWSQELLLTRDSILDRSLGVLLPVGVKNPLLSCLTTLIKKTLGKMSGLEIALL